jgi:hypothetical protein
MVSSKQVGKIDGPVKSAGLGSFRTRPNVCMEVF